MTAPHIVVLGGLNMDLVARVTALPRPGETVTGTSFNTFPGGKGANQAVAAARLGARVSMVGRTGGDAFGLELRNGLQAEGISTVHVFEDTEYPSGVALIFVEDSGQNAIAVAPGANMQVTPAEVESALEALAPFDLLQMPLEVPLEAIVAAAKRAHQLGARVSLNPAPAQPLPDELIAATDVLAPNETEAAALTGIEVTDDAAAQAAARKLQDGIPRLTVLTLGGRGALLLDPEGRFIRIAAHSVPVVDTVAAGDAFVAGLAVGLGEGLSPEAAARLANAAGALAVTRAGAQTSLPTRQEVERLLGK